VADIEIEAQAGEAGLVHEGAEIGGIAHFAGSVFDADSYAAVVGVENQMFEGTEGGVALSRVGAVARTAHVQNHAGIWQIFGDIDGAFQLVHGFDAAHTFHFADGERGATFARGALIAVGRSVKRYERELIGFERGGHGLDFSGRTVIEVAAGTEKLDPLEARSSDLAEQV